MHLKSTPVTDFKKQRNYTFPIGRLCFKVKRNWFCALPEVDEEQGWEEALADEGAGGWSAVGGVGGEFVEFPRISPACFSTWYMASTSAHTR